MVKIITMFSLFLLGMLANAQATEKKTASDNFSSAKVRMNENPVAISTQLASN